MKVNHRLLLHTYYLISHVVETYYVYTNHNFCTSTDYQSCFIVFYKFIIAH